MERGKEQRLARRCRRRGIHFQNNEIARHNPSRWNLDCKKHLERGFGSRGGSTSKRCRFVFEQRTREPSKVGKKQEIHRPPQETRSRNSRARRHLDTPKNPPETTFKFASEGRRPGTFEAKGGNQCLATKRKRQRPCKSINCTKGIASSTFRQRWGPKRRMTTLGKRHLDRMVIGDADLVKNWSADDVDFRLRVITTTC